MARKGTAKLEELKRIESEAQTFWANCKVFELDAPENGVQEKYFATFPYPYMNGRLHLGHTFSLSKCEFAIGYERLKGKLALWPFGFHCTGTPILASADKLKNEIATYGCPPSFPTTETSSKPTNEPKEVGGDRSKSKKSKAVAKTGLLKFQWQIMASLGLSDDEIVKFTDPKHWMQYFPKMAIQDLKHLGVKVDWRRSFITTDRNAFYDSFVRWQFLHLQQAGRIKYGKRYTIFSPKDNQPCMDHERTVGEGVVPQEYVLIKLKVVSKPPPKLSDITEPIFLTAATLRPETMYGQTNCWLHPDLDYVAVRSVTEQCVLVCTERSARNMAYQGILDPDQPGKLDIVARVKGSDLFGLRLSAPLASGYPDGVYSLPMLSIKASKGTGVVTSVPGDSPDDLAALRDLKKKPALREKYGITDEMVLPFEPVEIIDTPAYGRLSAVTVVDQMKIQSQNDTEKLQEAKEKVYRAGFYEGFMAIGKYAGSKVQDAKKMVQTDIIADKQAIIYYEPEGLVLSRSGDEAVVSLCNQWYLDYGKEEWKQDVQRALDQLTVTDEVRRGFVSTLDWLHEHACSRTYGLGTRLPWDSDWLIESLSDSTIYMAFYTVAHLLHKRGCLDASQKSASGIMPEDMTPEVWDYVMLGVGEPTKLVSSLKLRSLTPELLTLMRRELTFWYPVDLRSSGKDLIPNHLTYFLYHHTAIWPNEPKMWPRSVRANGHLLLNSAKMSKSTGNFLTLSDAVEKYSADGVRLALADAGDSMDDANMKEDMAEAGLLRIFSYLDWVRQTLAALNGEPTSNSNGDQMFRTGEYSLHCDLVFENDINRTIEIADKLYANQEYREALKTVFYEFQACRDRYREVSMSSLHSGLIRRYIDVQTLLLSPICSHVCEYIWRDLLKNSQTSMFATANWPKLSRPVVDDLLTLQGRYVDDVAHRFRIQLIQHQASRSKAKGDGGKNAKKGSSALDANAQDSSSSAPAPRQATVWVCTAYPDWQALILSLLRDNLAPDPSTSQPSLPDNAKMATLLKPHLKSMPGKAAKKAMPFVQLVRQRFIARGSKVLQVELEIDELKVLSDNLDYLSGTLGLEDGLNIKSISECTDAKLIDSVEPLGPVVVFNEAPPSAVIDLINTDVGLGLFSLPGFAIYDGDTPRDVLTRALVSASSIGRSNSDRQSLALYCFADPSSPDTVRVPPYAKDAMLKLEPSSCRFSVDSSKLSVLVDGKSRPVGSKLIYSLA